MKFKILIAVESYKKEVLYGNVGIKSLRDFCTLSGLFFSASFLERMARDAAGKGEKKRWNLMRPNLKRGRREAASFIILKNIILLIND